MSLSSMTGFARASGEADWGSWVWEARSVNGRGLDVRINVPSGLEAAEKAVKAGVSARFTRGNFQIGLRIEKADHNAGVSVNEAALKTLMEAYERVDGTIASGPALAALMGMKGVVEAGAPSLRALADQPEAMGLLIASGEAALDQLEVARLKEGEKLGCICLGQMSEIGSLTKQAVGFAADQVTSIQKLYQARIIELDTDGAVSNERLVSEIAVLAAKADVSEELDRLKAHVESGRDLLAATEAIGRNLGFLSQELNREANTLCSKSATLDLTNTGLALKSVIDQFKEQAANVE